MSYCLAMLIDDGLLFVSDSRTNAGIDSIASYRKTFVFETEDRCIVVLTAGNLAVTQSVISRLEESLDNPSPGEPNLHNVSSMFEVARLVGNAVREVYDEDADYMKKQGVDFSASLIVGGQIKGRRMRLFNVYSAGNFLEATWETPYFQIGETKYGKPIIERVLTTHTALSDAMKCALVSFDSTIRSNLSVGPPLDITVVLRDEAKVNLRLTLGEDDPYLGTLGTTWSEGLHALFRQLPSPDWLNDLD